MKLKYILIVTLLLALVSGFVFLAVSDVPVEPVEVRKTIPNDRFFEE